MDKINSLFRCSHYEYAWTHGDDSMYVHLYKHRLYIVVKHPCGRPTAVLFIPNPSSLCAVIECVKQAMVWQLLQHSAEWTLWSDVFSLCLVASRNFINSLPCIADEHQAGSAMSSCCVYKYIYHRNGKSYLYHRNGKSRICQKSQERNQWSKCIFL